MQSSCKVWNMSVCNLHMSRTVNLIYFTLGRFVAEDSWKSGVKLQFVNAAHAYCMHINKS